jgi:GAF domain-containing protein
MDKGDHPDMVVVIAVNESGDLTLDDIDDTLREVHRLMPYLTDVPLAPVTLPITRTIALEKTLSSGASDADLERVLTAMISAEEESERYSADFAALNAIGDMLLRLNDDPALVLYELIVKIRETIAAKAAWLYLPTGHQDGDQLEMRARVGLSRAFVEGRTTLAWGEGIEGQVAQAGEGVFIEDMESIDASALERELGAIAALPLVGAGGVVGVLAVGMESPMFWRPRHVRLLTAISQQVGMVVENGRLSQEIQSSMQSLADNSQTLHEIRQLLNVD